MENSEPTVPEGDSCSSKACCERRCFLSATVSVVASAAALAVPAVAALVSFFNPLRQKSPAGRLVKLTDLAMLPEDGTPQSFPVVTDKTDAWTHAANQVIGSVYLRRTGEDSRPVEALQVVCPHAGCSVVYHADDGGRFFCPCHAAGFDLSGRRTDEGSMSPRDMDSLEVEIRNQQEVWVKFENFMTGTGKKVVES